MPWHKPVLSPFSHTLVLPNPIVLLIHFNCPSSRNPKPLRLEMGRLLRSPFQTVCALSPEGRPQDENQPRFYGGNDRDVCAGLHGDRRESGGCRHALGKGQASQQAVLWVCSPSRDGTSRGWAAEWVPRVGPLAPAKTHAASPHAPSGRPLPGQPPSPPLLAQQGASLRC